MLPTNHKSGPWSRKEQEIQRITLLAPKDHRRLNQEYYQYLPNNTQH